MSIKRINEFPEGSGNLTNDDIFLFMDDPSGAAVTKKISLSQVAAAIGSVGGAGSADTGDVSFSGLQIIGTGTLELVPNSGLYNNDQYLVVDPTAPNHIHLRAGGNIDESSAELILGGELAHVKVADYAHEVKVKAGIPGNPLGYITINPYAIGNGSDPFQPLGSIDDPNEQQIPDGTWWLLLPELDPPPPVGAKFIVDGVERTITSVEYADGPLAWAITFTPGGSFPLAPFQLYTPEISKEWTFANDGNLNIPGGLIFPDGSSQISAATSGLSDSDRYVICKAGDDIAAKYAAAKLLTPGGSSKSATNRAYLIVMPGVYPLSAQWEIDAEFVDVIGLGSSSLERGCNVAVTVTGYDINASADNVRIKGIGTTSDRAFKIGGIKPLQVFEECVGGEASFGGYGTASGTFTNCSGGVASFGGYGTASGTFTNCSGGVASFGGGDDLSAGTASGSFTNCSGGLYSFGGYGTASGSFTNCSGGAASFGGYGSASGTFTNCSGGNSSFGGDSGGASGTFTNCSGGIGSFGGGNGTASGSFTNCTGGNLSFGGGLGSASGTFTNCSGGIGSFGGDGTASGIFKDCTGGDSSFGGYGTASGSFTNCVGGIGSFGGGGNASGIFKDCVGGNESFGSGNTASGSFTNCTGGDGSFGGFSNYSIVNGNATGNFTNCTGGNQSFGGFGGSGDGSASGKFLRCTTTGSFYTLSGNGKYRLCIDGNYDVINADASPPPPPTPRTLYFNGALNHDWATLGNWWNDAGFTSPATSLPTSVDSVVLGAADLGFQMINTGSEPTVANLTVVDSVLYMNITVTGAASFEGIASYASFTPGHTLTGSATFRFLSSNGGHVTGTATFDGGACNAGGGTAGTFVPDPPPSC